MYFMRTCKNDNNVSSMFLHKTPNNYFINGDKNY